MSFSTVCSNCDARLTAPDTVEGKRVKCKKCGEAFLAKRDSEDDDERSAKPIKSPVKMPGVKPRSKPVRDDDGSPRRSAMAAQRPADDDEDDAEEEEPKPKAKKNGKGKSKKQAGTPVLLYVLIGVGALLVLGGGSVGAYYAFIKDDAKPGPSAKGEATSLPTTGGAAEGGATTGWLDVQEPVGKYRIKFPTKPHSETHTEQGPTGPIEIKAYAVEGGIGGQWELFSSLHIPIGNGRFGATDEQILDAFVRLFGERFKEATVTGTKNIIHQTFQGRELTVKHTDKEGTTIQRFIVAGERIIVLVAGAKTVSADAPRVKTFFDSLKIE
jgi:DNA-directed RNA polymerase subunit RPC12/RpoP